ncbi:MAG: LCP family protein [Acutalibacteraceae bacterium]
MSENNYYSANEKTGKLKVFIAVLWVLLVVCLLAGGIFTFAYIKGLEKNNTVKDDIANQTNEAVNVLVTVVDEDNEDIDPQFLLVGFDFEMKNITVTEIPANIKLTAPEKTDTVKNLFEYGSASYVRSAVVNQYGISVQRYIKCSLSEVERFVDSLGGIDYEITEKMQYENKEGNLVTNLVKGKQKLNGNQYCQYLRYNGWSSAAEKAEKREELLVSLLNEYCSTLDPETIVSIYKKVANSLETDISIVEVNNFSLQFRTFLNVEAPAIRADIDFKDSEVAKVKIEKFYQ